MPPIVPEVLRSAGRPLDAGTQAFMESTFGHDFSRVRVHTDDRAADSAGAVNAPAYTVGREVVFGAGQYMPRTAKGLGLLAHELAHVVQQGDMDARSKGELALGSPTDAYEREADRAAAAIMQAGADRAEPIREAVSVPQHGAETGLIQRSKKGALIGAIGGGLIGAVIGGLLGGLPGALIGGLIGAGLGALVGALIKGSKLSVSDSCKNFCPAVDVVEEAKKADAKTSSPCKDVVFTYQVSGEPATRQFRDKVDFSSCSVTCDPANADCGGWSSKGVITLGKNACNAGVCGPLASSLLHEMVHDWAGWGPPYDQRNVTVPGAAHGAPDYLDEWVGRYIEKECFSYNPWGLP